MAGSSKRGVGIPLWFATIVFSVLLGFFIYPVTTGGLANPGAWDHKDLVTILLTVVTVVLAALGLGIAVLAIWGYYRLQATAEDRAAEVAEATTDSHLRGEDFREQVSAVIDEIYSSRASEIDDFFRRIAAEKVTLAGQAEEPEDGEPAAQPGAVPPTPPSPPEGGA